MSLSRRDLFRAAPAAVLAAGIPGRRDARAANEPLIVRMQEPRNLETPLSELFSADTEKFFVRSHFAVPTDHANAKGFKLTVEGHVENRLELSIDDLRK